MAGPQVLFTIEDLARKKHPMRKRARLAQLIADGRIPGPDLVVGRLKFWSPERFAAAVAAPVEDRRRERGNFVSH